VNGSWFGLIEMLLVFGLVGLWCWNELRVLKRDNAAAARREARRETERDDPSGQAADEPPTPPRV